MPTSDDDQSRRRFRFTFEDAKVIALGLAGLAVAVLFLQEVFGGPSKEEECEAAQLVASSYLDGSVTLIEHGRYTESDEAFRMGAGAIVASPQCFSEQDVYDAQAVLSKTP